MNDIAGWPARPDGWSTAALLELADRVLGQVRSGAGAAAQAEVSVDHRILALTRFANSAIHQNLVEQTCTIRLRLHVNGRTASGSTSLTTPDAVAALVDRALSAATHCPPDPDWPGLAPAAALAGAGSYDEDTADARPAERAERVREFVAAAGGLSTAGYCRTARWLGAFANTAGQRVAGRRSEATMDGVARYRGADGVARLASPTLAGLDGAALGRRAAAKARAAADPVELAPGRYPVVLEPIAVCDLLENLAIFGFNGKALAERRTFAQPGAAQFDPAITLVDAEPGAGAGAPFDTEGTVRQRLVLVEAGTTRTVAHDRRTAARLGTRSTGHASATSTSQGPFPTNMSLVPAPTARPVTADLPVTAGPPAGAQAGTAPATGRPGDVPPRGGGLPGAVADASVAELVGGVERGLLVTDLWYTRVLDPRTLAVTGLTRNGLWLIERGEVTRPVRDLRFTQSYPQALAPGAVLGVGSHAAGLPGVFLTSWAQAPALHLASWNFTGGATG